MSIWHVNLQHRLEEPPDAEALDALTDALAAFDVAVGVDPQHLLSIGVRIEAKTLRAATERADREILQALDTAGVDGTTVGVETLTWDEFERRVLEPVVPPLASLQDLADILGESKQHTQQLVDRYPDQLPAVAETKAGRVWLVATAHRFKTFPRASRGRPPKSFEQRARELVDVAIAWATDKQLPTQQHDAGGLEAIAAGITVRVTLPADEVGGVIEVTSPAGSKRYDEVDVPTPRELRAVLEHHVKKLPGAAARA